MMNENEEKLYEMAENELANEPRRGLLAKCRALCFGEENRANARYVQVRVKEMQDEILEQQIREAEAQGAKPSYAIRILRAALFRDTKRKSRRWRN